MESSLVDVRETDVSERNSKVSILSYNNKLQSSEQPVLEFVFEDGKSLYLEAQDLNGYLIPKIFYERPDGINSITEIGTFSTSPHEISSFGFCNKHNAKLINNTSNPQSWTGEIVKALHAKSKPSNSSAFSNFVTSATGLISALPGRCAGYSLKLLGELPDSSSSSTQEQKIHDQ